MFASQLIYTGCGKDRTGAFSVWSKSSDITAGEEKEIREKMMYKRPRELPFEPTQEEIDNLFPKKLGYFYLSTGRVCLAQSVYVGDFYSDLDMRIGNYIIHAFVFDKEEDVLPMRFIESDLFKRGLTYEEWHEQDAPDELPKIEVLNDMGALTKQEIDSFFKDSNATHFMMLLQAVINASVTDQKVTFHDAHKNLKYWYKALSLCLPKCMQKALTFSTFFTPSLPVPSQNQPTSSIVNTDIKIRNISPSASPTLFNYQQDIRSGKYSFDFESGLLPENIKVGAYVLEVVSRMRANLFDAIMLVDSVEKISFKCNVDLDTALDIHYLLNKQINRIDDIAKLDRLLGYTIEHYQDALQGIADCLYEYGIKSEKWKLSSSITKIYRFVFDYSEVADKSNMIHKFVVNQSAFGVAVDASCNDYYNSFRICAPFAWVNFLDYVFEGNNLKKYVDATGASFNSRYLIFAVFAESMLEISEVQEQKNVALRYFVDTTQYYIKKEQLNEVLALVSCIEKCGSKWQGWLIEKAYSLMCVEKKRLSNICAPAFTLSLIESCENITVAKKIVSQLIMENEQNNAFIKLYVERYDRNTSFYSGLHKELVVDARCATFLDNVELYRFSVSQTVTKKQLQSYYDDYFVLGKDKEGLFAKKMKQYLACYKGEDCIRESLSCYDLWMKGEKIDPAALNSCVSVICDAVFSVSNDVLKEYVAVETKQRIEEMLERLANNYRVPNRYYVIVFGEYVKSLAAGVESKKASHKQDVLNQLSQSTFYALPKDESSKDLFVSMYLEDLLHLYLMLATEENFEDIYTQMFKPLHTSEQFGTYFRKGLNSLTSKDYELVLGDTIICACGKSNKFSEYLTQFSEDLLDDMGRGKKKKFLAQLLESIPAQYEKKTRAFVEVYQKNHASFLEKIFRTLKKKSNKPEAKRNPSKTKKK